MKKYFSPLNTALITLGIVLAVMIGGMLIAKANPDPSQTESSGFTVEDMQPFAVLKHRTCLNKDDTAQWLNDRALVLVRNVPNLKPDYAMFVDRISKNTAILKAEPSLLDSNKFVYCLFGYGIVEVPNSLGR